MDEDTREVIAHSLGNPLRDFKKEPLSQDEITAVIFTFSGELEKSDLEPELRQIYVECIEILKKHVLLH